MSVEVIASQRQTRHGWALNNQVAYLRYVLRAGREPTQSVTTGSEKLAALFDGGTRRQVPCLASVIDCSLDRLVRGWLHTYIGEQTTPPESTETN